MINAPAQVYMLDTSEFNRVLDGKIPPSFFAGRRLMVIGIQRYELNKSKNEKRRTALLATFEAISPHVGCASSFAWGIKGAGWGQACWNDGSGNFEKMLDRLRTLDARKKKRKDSGNQLRDILIAETAIKSGAILVSGDSNLRQVVGEFAGRAIDPTRTSGIM
jgi:hypothetical protein